MVPFKIAFQNASTKASILAKLIGAGYLVSEESLLGDEVLGLDEQPEALLQLNLTFPEISAVKTVLKRLRGDHTCAF